MAQHALSPNDLLEAASLLPTAELDRFVSDLLALRAGRVAPRLPPAETALLLRINRGLPEDRRKIYDALRGKLAQGTLGDGEHAELLRMTDEVERLQAERVEALAELARLRGKGLRELMRDLGIGGHEDGGSDH
jgi:hypothetical protein